MSRSSESFAEFLEYGKAPLVRQLTAWVATQEGRPGPFVVRMTTEAEGMGTEEVFREAFDGDELTQDVVPNLVDAMRDAVVMRHGPEPLCVIRVQAYHEGESADPKHLHRRQVVAPRAGGSATSAAFTNNEFAWGVVTMLMSQNAQAHAQIVNLSAHLAAQGAAATQALATVSSFRAVGTTAADMTSGGPMGAVMGLVAPAMLAFMWPDVKKLLEGSKDGESTLSGLLKLFAATTKNAVTSTEAQGQVAEALHTSTLQIEERIEPVEFSWADEQHVPVTPDQVALATGDENFAGTAPSAAPVSVSQFIELAEQNPDAVMEFIENAGPKTRTWFQENAFNLMSKL